MSEAKLGVFISWSGPKAQAVANLLHSWLPQVLQAVAPWTSTKDIPLGKIWMAEIQKELNGRPVGLIVVTPENKGRPFLNFEAGAILKSVENVGIAIPVCVDISPDDIGEPLSSLNGVRVDKAGMDRLVLDLNANLPASFRMEVAQAQKCFEKWWDDFDQGIQKINKEYPKERQAITHVDYDQLTAETHQHVKLILEQLAELPERLQPKPTFESGVSMGLQEAMDRLSGRGTGQAQRWTEEDVNRKAMLVVDLADILVQDADIDRPLIRKYLIPIEESTLEEYKKRLANGEPPGAILKEARLKAVRFRPPR